MSEAVSKLSLETKIKLKYKEWEVEITCVEDKVKNVVENVLTGIDIASLSGTNTNSEIEKLKTEIDLLKSKIDGDSNLQNLNQKRNNVSLKELAKNGNTCRSLMEKIFYEKFFESERLLIEVHQELSRGLGNLVFRSRLLFLQPEFPGQSRASGAAAVRYPPLRRSAPPV
jgi:hypothetical protein